MNKTNLKRKMEDITVLQRKRVLKCLAAQHDSMILHTTLNSFINSYKGNNNTGTRAEIAAGVQLIISSGLDSIQNLDKSIKNRAIWEKIEPKKELGVMFMGMIGIYNYTQDDNVGKADIGVAFPGFTWKYSITKLHRFKKALSNIGTQGINYNEMYKELIREQYLKALPIKIELGGNPLPKGVPDENARIIYEKATEHFADYINKLPEKKKKKFMFKGLGLTDKGKLDSDGIIYSNDTGINFIYLWKLKYNPNIYFKNVFAQPGYSSYDHKPNDAKSYVNLTLEVDDDDIKIINIQVKFNDGLVDHILKCSKWKKRKTEHASGEKPLTGSDFKPGSIGSFNFVAEDIRNIYDLALVYQK